MEGAAERTKRQADLAFWTAWHVEAFARMEGRDFKQALKDRFADEETSAANSHVQAIAFFHGLKARGVPIEITRH